MKCSIMQPTYFPWPGYFNLMAQSDIFVFLDDVQFEKSSWQNRNRILLNDNPHWFSVPVLKKKLSQTIQFSEIDSRENWREKHYKLLTQAYAKHPYIQDVKELSEIILDSSVTMLAEMNIKIITLICSHLGIRTKLLRSSELNIEGKRTDRLIRICDCLGCDEYLSPLGSADYLAEDNFVNKTKVRLSFQDYAPQEYPQLKATRFIDHLSIVDVLANLGWNAAFEYVTNGRVSEIERGLL